jgi:cytochrome c oxidase assembly protein subunit 15
MGCPDWPKCFGSWVPPTSEADLPADYRESFAQIRVEKNKKLVGYLKSLGLQELSEEIMSENMAAPEAAFNKNKTWTEYINRLMGVLLGFIITIMAVISGAFRVSQPALFYGSLGALLLVAFQGWIGSVVVSTNLLPGMVTFHMALAAILIGLLIYLYHLSSGDRYGSGVNISKPIRFILVLSMALFFIQIASGTQVREAIDLAALQSGLVRQQWISSLGGAYYFHRTFSLLLLALGGYQLWYFHRLGQDVLKSQANRLFLLIVVEAVLGVVMAYFGVPAWAQPLHLLVALLILGQQYHLFLFVKKSSMA